MAFDLSGFKTALTYGGARPSLFEFVFTAAPTGISSTLESMNLFCNVTEIPPLTITPIERQYFGRTVKIPGEMTFGDLSTDIINTESFQVRIELEKWMDLINAPNVNQMSADTTSGMDHTGTGNVFQRTKAGNTTLQVQFIDMFPTSVSEIALSYDTTSDFEQFDVTWAYQTFKYIPKGDNTNSTLN